MKHFFTLLSLLIATSLACSLGNSSTPVPSTVTLPPPAGTSLPVPPANPCGDGTCEEPETAQNCPADCPAPATESVPLAEPQPLHRPTDLQIGLNFIRFYMDDLPIGPPNRQTAYLQPSWIFDDFADLGIHAYRQFVRADLLWDMVEPQDDQWYFDEADAVIPNAEFEPIVTLFAMQHASATPPWETDPSRFQKTLGAEAEEYLEKVIERYGPYVKYWELGNEMDHWSTFDPGAPPAQQARAPRVIPPNGFSPQEQGVFLAQAAAYIRARDPDAVIVMPGMSSLDNYQVNTWLAGVIAGGGTDWFDIVNYHYYSSWDAFAIQREQFQVFLEKKGLQGKAVWLTETGSTADESLALRTDYPNSYTSQAADIFRRIVPAYALGDDLVLWHTYIDSKNSPTNPWRLYGIRSDQGAAHPSLSTLKLLTQELLPFEKVEALSKNPGGVNAYKITTRAGAVKYVAWGMGSYTAPEGVTQFASVIPAADGSFQWQAAQAGQSLPLTEYPLLLK